MIVQPAGPVRPTEYERGKLAGWREGYQAAMNDVIQRHGVDREVTDRLIIERLTEVLAQLRERAA